MNLYFLTYKSISVLHRMQLTDAGSHIHIPHQPSIRRCEEYLKKEDERIREAKGRAALSGPTDQHHLRVSIERQGEMPKWLDWESSASRFRYCNWICREMVLNRSPICNFYCTPLVEMTKLLILQSYLHYTLYSPYRWPPKKRRFFLSLISLSPLSSQHWVSTNCS